MKSRLFVLSILLLGTTVFSSSACFGQAIQKVTAKYKEVMESGQFLFVDKDSKEFVFDDVDYDVELDIYDEGLLGKTFNISWKEEEMEEYDEEGEPTGSHSTYRTIMTISAAK